MVLQEEVSLLATLPIMNKLIVTVIPRLISRALRVIRNQQFFSTTAQKMRNIQKFLQVLGAVEVYSDDIPVYNFFHQLEGIFLNVSDFLDQYEDQHFSPSFIVTEVCIRQIRELEGQLDAVTKVLRACGRAFPTRLLQVQDLTPYFDQSPKADELRHMVYWPQITLPTALQRSLGQPPESLTPAMAHAVHGQWLQVEASLREHPSDVFVAGPVHNLLHMATLWQDPFAIAMLLGKGAPIDAPTARDGLLCKGSTALHIAVALGNAPIAKLLLCSGARGDVADARGLTPNALATSQGCVAMFKGAARLRDIALEMGEAADNKHWKTLSGLMRGHAVPLDFCTTSEGGTFLVHAAATANDVTMYQLLISAGASPLLRNANNCLPSEVAEHAGQHSLVGVLKRVEKYYANTMTPDPPRRPLADRQFYPPVRNCSARPVNADGSLPPDRTASPKGSPGLLCPRPSACSAASSSPAPNRTDPGSPFGDADSATGSARESPLLPTTEGGFPAKPPRRAPLLRLVGRLAPRACVGRGV